MTLDEKAIAELLRLRALEQTSDALAKADPMNDAKAGTNAVNYTEYIGALEEAAPDLLGCALLGIKAKAFLEEHGVALHDGCLWAVSETFGTSREASGVAAGKAAKALSDILDSARALTEAKGGK